MHSKGYTLIGLFLLIWSHAIYAQELKIAAGLTRAPYLMSKSQSGIEVDIVKESLRKSGYTTNFKYFPYRLGFAQFNQGKFDAILTANAALPINNGFYSTPYVSYENVVITLAEKQHTITHLEQMSTMRIVSFPEAQKYLGPAYKTMTLSSPSYKEFNNHSKQILMLFTGRTDAIVLDINIFKYFFNQLKTTNVSLNLDKPITVHRLFDKFDFSVAFKDQQVRDDFNAAFASLKKAERVQAIVDSYVSVPAAGN